MSAAHAGVAGSRWLEAVGVWLRVGALAVAAALVAAGERPVGDARLAVGTALLALVALAVGVARRWGRAPGAAALVGEVALTTVVVVATGGWASPYVLSVAVPIMVATVRVGPPAVLLAPAAVGAVAVTGVAAGDGLPAPAGTLPLALPVVVAVAVALGMERAGRRDPAGPGDDRLAELGALNALLAGLHERMRVSPTPLEVADVAAEVLPELEERFAPDALALLLEDGDGRWWRAADVPRTVPVGEVAHADLPAELLAAGDDQAPVAVPRLGRGSGLTPTARAGVYQWLVSRDRRVALLAIEHDEPTRHAEANLAMLARLAPSLALALDNAVWFRRLRSLGAEEERQRLGAQLHDRFAQSLAYVALELDRAVQRHADDPELVAVREDVRATLRELRATLRDLRLRCTEERGLADALVEVLDRVEQRTGCATRLDVGAGFPRLPLPLENQLLRTVQELVELAGHPREVTEVGVRLVAQEERLRVVVHDDGEGRDDDELDRERATALAGARDRADAIGARLDRHARPGRGTETAMTLKRP